MRSSMKGEMERDPTMDSRIVHSVGVSNKKEMSTLHHKERSLKSAKNVQEHIHRREEKELIRQLTKLQDEKCRRHPDMLNSRSQSRTSSRLSGPRTDSNTNMILQVNHTTGHLPGGGKLTGGKSIHNASVGSRSQLTGHQTATPSGLQRGRSSHQALMTRRQSVDIMRDGVGPVPGSSGRYTSISDLTRGHAGMTGIGSKHTSVGISPQVSYELNQGPPPVHQPAGYGHTIKEYVNREGLNKKRPAHSYMEPKGGSMHRRASVSMEDRMKGSQMTLARPGDTGSRISLNTSFHSHHQGPRASSHLLAGGGPRSRESGHMIAGPPTSSHGMAIPSRFLLSKLFSGQAVLEETPEQERKESKRHRTPSDHSSTESTESETVLNLECHDDLDEGDEPSTSQGSDHKVHFKEEKKQEDKAVDDTPAATRKERRVGKSDHVVAARRESPSKFKSNRKSAQTKEQPKSKISPPKDKKATSKSAHVVKLSSESKHDHHDSGREHIKKAKSKDASHSHIHIPMDVLNDLRSALYNNKADGAGVNIEELIAGSVGSSTAYDPSSNSVQNRRFRAQLRALQCINSQAAAQRQQHDADPAMNFDPLQVLRCRYLRLSQSNIDTLLEMCRESGIEVGVHPHMNIEDIGKFVFDSKKPKSKTSSSTSVSVEKVIV
ncbi:uncharacterized protein LOC129268540 [Lytechinus pictus]|uniref:uncharacterized protein LOC129268540 n=1 Tax=Lytechinus pictus TaxID=7653 RepID=UPI0030B9E4B2